MSHGEETVRSRWKVRCAWLAACAWLILPSAGAAVGSVQEYLREIGRAQEKIATLRARFVQEKHISIVREVLRSSGVFTLDRRGRVAWDVTEPERMRIVLSPEGVFAGGRKVSSVGPPGISPLPFLQRFTGLFAGLSESLTEDFEVTLVDRDRLRLAPRAPALSTWVQAIEIALDPTQKIPVHVRLEEPGGDVTDIEFSELAVNPKLDDGAFAP